MREGLVPVEEVYRSDVNTSANLYTAALSAWLLIKDDQGVPEPVKYLIQSSLSDRKKDLVIKMTHNPRWFSENLILLLRKLEELK